MSEPSGGRPTDGSRPRRGPCHRNERARRCYGPPCRTAACSTTADGKEPLRLEDSARPPTVRHAFSIGPTIGDGSVRSFAAPCPFGDRKARRQSREFAQALSDMTEVDPRLQALDQAERIALGVAGRIPPTASAVADDQDLALATPVFQAELGALLPVEQSRAAAYARARRRNAPCRAALRFPGRSWSLLAFERRELGCLAFGFSSPLPCPPTARRARCKGARNAREPRDEPLFKPAAPIAGGA